MCVSEAPEVFAFDNESRRVKILRPQLEGDEALALRPRVDAALTYCPTMALRTAALRAAAPPDATALDPDLNPENQGDE